MPALHQWRNALNKLITLVTLMTLTAASPGFAQGEKKYGPGVTDTEIKLGQTMPYSGPASSLSLIGKVEVAYFKMINARGGVNGRKINLISLDDGFNPAKTVEQTRKLVEGDEVLAIFSTEGSASNLAIAKYMNSRKVPQLLGQAGSPKLIDPTNLPWTTTFYTTSSLEGRQLAVFLLETKANAKVGIIYQNDDNGRSYMDGMKSGLGKKAATMLVKEVGFDLTYPTIDSQMLSLQAAGADTIFFATTTPKFVAQGIRKIAELGWKPLMLLTFPASSIETTLKPAGLEHAIGAVTSIYSKDPGDPKWRDDPAVQDYYKFMKEWAPGEPPTDSTGRIGYIAAQMMVEILMRCGDDLTRENLLYHATHIKDFQIPMFVSGIKINVTPEDRVPWKQAQMVRFDGRSYEFIGGIVTAPGDK
jgi:branched-chain amino acid transport system substrate-binding protein